MFLHSTADYLQESKGAITMSVQKRKGIRDIKTHAGTVKKMYLPHEVYMRISTLEMERVHRLREMESAQKRIRTIMDRLKEIDDEKGNLLNHIKAKAEYLQENRKVQTKTDDMYGNNKGRLLKY